MNNFLIDTHAHLYKEYFSDINEVVNRANSASIKYIINSGTNSCTNKEVIESADEYKNILCTIGIHPEHANEYLDEDIEFIKKNISNNNVIGIGEIGLDYYYTSDNKVEQVNLFEKQLKIAEENNIPVVIHSREATLDTINILKKYKVRGIIHSFSGSYETAMNYISMGFLLGINGVVTFKNSKIKEVFEKIDLNNLVFETDCPYLTPHPFRGKKNEPSYIEYTAGFIAELKNVSLDELARITTENVNNLFSLDLK